MNQTLVDDLVHTLERLADVAPPRRMALVRLRSMLMGLWFVITLVHLVLRHCRREGLRLRWAGDGWELITPSELRDSRLRSLKSLTNQALWLALPAPHRDDVLGDLHTQYLKARESHGSSFACWAYAWDAAEAVVRLRPWLWRALRITICLAAAKYFI